MLLIRQLSCSVAHSERRKVVTGVELIYAADPFQTGLGKIVESGQVVISRQTVDGLDADLVESGEEILGHVNGPLQVFCPEICSHCCASFNVGSMMITRKLWDQKWTRYGFGCDERSLYLLQKTSTGGRYPAVFHLARWVRPLHVVGPSQMPTIGDVIDAAYFMDLNQHRPTESKTHSCRARPVALVAHLNDRMSSPAVRVSAGVCLCAARSRPRQRIITRAKMLVLPKNN